MKNKEYFKTRAIKRYDNGAKSIKSLRMIRNDFELTKIYTLLKIKLTNLKEGDLLLDVGCGEGLDMISFNENNIKTIGLDFSKGMLKASRNLYKEYNLDTPSIVNGDAEFLPFKDDLFDAIHSRDLSCFSSSSKRAASASALSSFSFNSDASSSGGISW